MASICNDEGVHLGGMSGHVGFVHTFSGQPWDRLGRTVGCASIAQQRASPCSGLGGTHWTALKPKPCRIFCPWAPRTKAMKAWAVAACLLAATCAMG